MAVNLPNGSIISVASAYGSEIDMTALTNAANGVATLEVGHGVVAGGVFEIQSGWSKLNQRIARAGEVETNTVVVDGVDTSDTTRYPAGSGAGSIRLVSSWQQVTQVVEAGTQGGEQQFTNYSFLEDDTERQIPTVKSPQSFQMQIGDDTSLGWYPILSAADYDRQPRALRVELPSGSVLYYNAYVTLNRTPTLTKNEIMTVQATFSFVAEVTRYAASA